MSNQEYNPAEPCTIETLPLLNINVTEVDPIAEMRAAGLGNLLLRDLRRDPDPRARIDGFEAANGIPTEGRTWSELDVAWSAARDRGELPESFFHRNVDTSKSRLEIMDAYPGEQIGPYMDYVAKTLQVDSNQPGQIPVPNLADAPGTRFKNKFGTDDDIVAIGKVFRGDREGARNTIDNSVHLIKQYGGVLLNFNGPDSLGRGHFPTLSFAVERLAAAYGKDGDEVTAHYREPLAKNLAYWMRGYSDLRRTPHNQGAVLNRLILLPGPERDIVPRFKGDAPKNLASWEGLRRESAAEDEELALRVLGDLRGEERDQRFERLMDDVEAACMSKHDFAPDWQSSDYHSLEKLRTTDIAPVALLGALVHQARMAGQPELASRMADTIMRRFYVRIDEQHSQLADLDRDGTPTKALYAEQFLPLAVGGIVPYEDALLLANTARDALIRKYGVLVSVGYADAQWVGNPSESGDPDKDAFVQKMQERMYGRSMLHKGGDNRSWASEGFWVEEAFTQAAIEAQLSGKDPGPLLEVANLAQICTIEGIEAKFESDRYIAEKSSALDPTRFVDGGEYAGTPEQVQKGFGMTIGAYRAMSSRNLQAEVNWPYEYSWRQFTLRHALGGLLVAQRTLGTQAQKYL